MESLLRCDTCRHGAALHEAGGCAAGGCTCAKSSGQLVDEALEAARNDIHREWQVSP